MMTVCVFRVVVSLGGCIALTLPVHAGQSKLDRDTCTQLHSEQSTFVQSGILADLQRGPEWGKSNLSADRLREIEHYILLDEQIKFACREATLTPDMMRAGEVAKRLELNPDLDPTLPETAGDGDGAGAADAPAGNAPAAAPKHKGHRPKASTAKPDAAKAASGAVTAPSAGASPAATP
jgi:hypothetical protein